MTKTPRLVANDNDMADNQQVSQNETPLAGSAPAPRPGSKSELVIGLLRSPDGATIAELSGATGWLPHTTRAALTSLRAKGHLVERAKRGDMTCYRIMAA